VKVRNRDPLRDPEGLIRRVYAYAAYRLGPGADAEDVTSETLVRAVRYRSGYDPAKGTPIAWVLGIARGCVEDHRSRRPAHAEQEETAAPLDLEAEAVQRLTVSDAVARLDARDRELIALRYGADLSTRQIGELLGMRANAVDVALHRSRERLRGELDREGYEAAGRRTLRVARPAAERGSA
jgi:RNA polymerase sigma-70 factor (ECF subfamily)